MKDTFNPPHPLPLKIRGVGRYLPERIVTNEEIEARLDLPQGWCERKQGIRERRWVGDETCSFMGAEAAREAVADAHTELTDIDMILNASQSFQQAVPEGGSLIQEELGLGDSGIPCMTVSCACLGFLAALWMGACLLNAGRYKNILIVNAEIGSTNLDPDRPEVFTLGGDAAAAVMITLPSPDELSGIQAVRMETYGSSANVSALAGSGIHQSMFSKELHPENLFFNFDPPAMQQAGLKYNQKFQAKMWPILDIHRLKLIIPNQASRLTLDYMKIIFPRDRVMGIIDYLGNCSAAGHPLALYKAIKEKRIERGDRVLLTGMGNGFSLLGVLLIY